MSEQIKPTKGQIYDAAIKWCGRKDREAFPEDIEYFKHNWPSLPGLRYLVEIEVALASGILPKMAPISAPEIEKPTLPVDCARLMPGGILDNSTFEQIEMVLDRAQAPATGPDGKWLSVVERLTALLNSYKK